MTMPSHDTPDMQFDTTFTSPKALPPPNGHWTIT